MSKRDNIEDVLGKIKDENLIEASENKLGKNTLTENNKKRSSTKEMIFAGIGISAIAATAIITVNMHNNIPVQDGPTNPIAVESSTAPTESTETESAETESTETESTEIESTETESTETESTEDKNLYPEDDTVWEYVVVDPPENNELFDEAVFAPLSTIDLDKFTPTQVKSWKWKYPDGNDMREMGYYHFMDENGLFIGSGEKDDHPDYIKNKYDSQGRIVDNGFGIYKYSEDGLSRIFRSTMIGDDTIQYEKYYEDKKSRLTYDYFDGGLRHMSLTASMELPVSHSGQTSVVDAEAYGYDRDGIFYIEITYTNKKRTIDTEKNEVNEYRTISQTYREIPMNEKETDYCVYISQMLTENIWDYMEDAIVIRRGIGNGNIDGDTFRYDEYDTSDERLVESHLYTYDGNKTTDKYIKFDYEFSDGDKTIGIAQSIDDIRIHEDSINCANSNRMMYYNINGKEDCNYIELQDFAGDIKFVCLFCGSDTDLLFKDAGEGFNADFSDISEMKYDDFGRIIYAANSSNTNILTIEYK